MIEDSYRATMLQRFSAAKTGWSIVREDYRTDLRYVCGDPALQWNQETKNNLDDEGIPALTFDRLTPVVMQIANATRKERPQPQVIAGDEGQPEVAEIIEGKMRHLQYISRAEIAYAHAELSAVMGGWGFYKITKDYVSKKPIRGKMSYDKEPRVERILDAMCSYPDPGVQMPDFSDAQYWFLRKRYTREDFKAEFGKEPISFPFDERLLDDWGDDKHVWVAEYYWIEKKTHRRITLWDGTEGRESDLEADPSLQQYQTEDGHFPPEYINAERDEDEVIVHCDIVDGAGTLEEGIVNADWIPIVVVTGTEIVCDGKRRFVSAIRYKRDQQNLINASISAVAEALGAASHTEYLGPKGIFKDGRWRDGKRHFYREYEPKDIYGQPVSGPPQRDSFEPPIQALTGTAALSIDAIKGADGYQDNITRPSQADISGVGVQRRQDQANLSNAHFQMNLVDAQWHGGRILMDMLIRETDTPRKWQVRKEDGSQRAVPVIGGDTDALVPGMEDQQHYRVDDGDYGLEITSGPTYAAKAEQEIDTLLEILKTNPEMWPIYAPTVFKRLGFTDLEEIAQLAMPPQFQQAMQARAQGVSPREAALTAQVQQMQAVIQHISQILQTKQIETDGKVQVENTKISGQLTVEKLKTIRALIEASQQHAHEAAVELTKHRTGAAEHLTQMAHEVKMADLAPQPQTGGAQ